MIRLILALVIVALLLMKLSEMFGAAGASEDPASPEESMIGAAYEPYTKAQKFSEEDYEKALQKQREEMDKKIDGG